MSSALSEPVPGAGECRILVLTSSTGGGHDHRAYALRDWVRALFGEGVPVRVEHILEGSGGLTRFGVGVYNWIQRRAPVLHNLYWWVAEAYGVLQGWGWDGGGRYFRNLLQSFRPTLVLSVHDSTNRGYFRVARQVLGDQVRCVTYCGEFCGGFGYSRIWVCPSVDRFYARTDEAALQAVSLGVPRERVRVFRNLLRPQMLEPPLSAEEVRRYRASELGLDPDRPTILLASGALGAGDHAHYLEGLAKDPGRWQAIAVCGKNLALRDKLERTAAASGRRFPIHLEGFSSRLHLLLQCADVVLTRPGANTAAEASYFGKYLLFDSRRSLMPQERLTQRYFLRHRAGERVGNAQVLRRVLAGWESDPPSWQEALRSAQAVRRSDHPADWARELVDLGGGPPQSAQEGGIRA